MQQQVTVRVPATTSNLGPGFDCLGAALRLYNEVTVSRSGIEEQAPLAREAAERFFAKIQCMPFPFTCSISGHVPSARGLGSSVTIRLGVLLGLSKLAGVRLSRQELFILGSELEGHPDNAAPATFGGFTIAQDATVQNYRISSRLRFVLLVPGFEVVTAEARRLLPQQIGRLDAIMSAQNAAAISGAFASRRYEKLRGCFRDGLHQPYRRKLVPFLDSVIAAAEKAGALGAFLSGSGSTICALTLHRTGAIAQAMLAAAESPGSSVIVTYADNRGAHVLSSASAKPPSPLP